MKCEQQQKLNPPFLDCVSIADVPCAPVGDLLPPLFKDVLGCSLATLQEKCQIFAAPPGGLKEKSEHTPSCKAASLPPQTQDKNMAIRNGLQHGLNLRLPPIVLALSLCCPAVWAEVPVPILQVVCSSNISERQTTRRH